MISGFEASILMFIGAGSWSRYDIMKGIQNQSIYWAGSPGAVYSAIARLEEKGFLKGTTATELKSFEITPTGLKTLSNFLLAPIPASKLLLDPVLLRVKLRGLADFELVAKDAFYRAQLSELEKAIAMAKEKHGCDAEKSIARDISNLVVAQLQLEHDLVRRLLIKDSEA